MAVLGLNETVDSVYQLYKGDTGYNEHACNEARYLELQEAHAPGIEISN